MKIKRNTIILAFTVVLVLINSLISYAEEEGMHGVGLMKPLGHRKSEWKERMEHKKEMRNIKADSLYFENNANFPLKITLYPVQKIERGPHASKKKGNPVVVDIKGPSTGRYPISGTFGQQGTEFKIEIEDQEGEFDKESPGAISEPIKFDWARGRSFTQNFDLKKAKKTDMPMKDVIKLLLYVEFVGNEEGGTIRMSLITPFNK